MINKFTICIPTYNRADRIRITIDSLLQQTYKNIEIIIVDNDSTDNTIEIVTSLQLKHPEIIKIYKNAKNIGMTANWNRCIELSTGTFTAIFHSDEVYHKNTIEIYEKILSKYNLDILSSKVSYDSSVLDARIKLDDIFDKVTIFENSYLSKIKYDEALIQITNACFNTKFLKKNKFDVNVKFYPDMEYQIRVSKTAKIGYLNFLTTYTELGKHQMSDEHLSVYFDHKHLSEKNKKALGNYIVDVETVIFKHFSNKTLNRDEKEYLSTLYCIIGFNYMLLNKKLSAMQSYLYAARKTVNIGKKLRRTFAFFLIMLNLNIVLVKNARKNISKVYSTTTK